MVKHLSLTQIGLVRMSSNCFLVKLLYSKTSSSNFPDGFEDVYVTYAYGDKWFFQEKASLKLVSENATFLDVGQKWQAGITVKSSYNFVIFSGEQYDGLCLYDYHMYR